MTPKRLAAIPPWEWPSNAGEILKSYLRKRDRPASDRLLAAELAGEYVVAEDEMAELLLSIVQNPKEPEMLRANAAASLGVALEDAYIEGYDEEDELRDASISEDTFDLVCESLRILFADPTVPKQVRRRVLEATSRAPKEWHVEAVRTAYYSGDSDWRLTAVFCMKGIRGFDREVIEALHSDDPEILYEAVRAAALPIPGAWPRIVELLKSKHTDEDVLFAAIEVVPYVRPEEAEEVLSPLLDSEDEEIAEAAQAAIAESKAALEDGDEDDSDDDDTHIDRTRLQ